MIPKSSLEIHNYSGPGYSPLVDHAGWRVAVLRYIDELQPHMIDRMQKHTETDEVFVLLQGSCILFIGEGEDLIHTIYALEMEPLNLYNIKQDTWHSHTLSEGTTVLIIENRDTDGSNSPEIELKPEQRSQIISMAKNVWKDIE